MRQNYFHSRNFFNIFKYNLNAQLVCAERSKLIQTINSENYISNMAVYITHIYV